MQYMASVRIAVLMLSKPAVMRMDKLNQCVASVKIAAPMCMLTKPAAMGVDRLNQYVHKHEPTHPFAHPSIHPNPTPTPPFPPPPHPTPPHPPTHIRLCTGGCLLLTLAGSGDAAVC